MNKRERVIAAIKGDEVDRVPAGFSLHFPAGQAFGEAGIKAHLDFFKSTDTDILKIMNENLVPYMGEIHTPEDWKKIKSISVKDGFMAAQLDMTARILDKCDKTAFTIGTVHGVVASAIHPIEARYGYRPVRELFCTHLRENREPMLDAFKRIAEGMCELVQGYREIGLDGIYYAALGGERNYFTDEEFEQYIAPLDKLILQVVKQNNGYSFLHMCKENLNIERYKGYSKLVDVVNWGVYEADISLEEGRRMFDGVTVMGGLANRSGVLVEGTEKELTQAVKDIIENFGRHKFILGADCTLPTEIPYERILAAVKAAK